MQVILHGVLYFEIRNWVYGRANTVYGLKIPCIYRLYGPREYIDKMKEIIDSLKTNGFV